MWLGVDPLSIFPVTAFLGHFTDVDLGVEVGGKSFAVAARVGVDDVEVVHLIEVVLGGIGSKYARDAGVKPAA